MLFAAAVHATIGPMDKLLRLCGTVSGSARLLWRLRWARVYLAAGMQRSGSTMLFNVIRLCLEERYAAGVSGGWIRDLGTLPIRDAVVLKVHDFNPVLCRRAAKIFYSFRDVRDALVSLRRKFGHEPSIDLCRDLLRNYLVAERLGAPMFQFETFVADIPGTVGRVAGILGFPVDVAAVAARVPAADGGGEAAAGTGSGTDENYDKTTLLHGHHGTGTGNGAWRDELSPELRRAIAAEFGWWLDRHGYSRE